MFFSYRSAFPGISASVPATETVAAEAAEVGGEKNPLVVDLS